MGTEGGNMKTLGMALIVVLVGCGGGGDSNGGGSSGGKCPGVMSDPANGEACNACSESYCCKELTACTETDCPMAAAAELVACLKTNCLGDECPAPVGGGGAGGAGGTTGASGGGGATAQGGAGGSMCAIMPNGLTADCQACNERECCVELTACAADTTCTDCLMNGGVGCASATFDNYVTCVSSKCATDCSSTDAGSPSGDASIACDDSCGRVDGICQYEGRATCDSGTDGTDCLGACDDSCGSVNGACEDPTLCAPNTDCTDCLGDSCGTANDGQCDEPACTMGTDCTDCGE